MEVGEEGGYTIQAIAQYHNQNDSCVKMGSNGNHFIVSLIVRDKVTTTVSTLSIVQELCESRGGRPGLSVLTSLLVSVDVKIY